MKFSKPLVVSFSLVAFASATAYADQAKEQKRDTQAQQQPTQRQADMPWDRDRAAAGGTQAALERGEMLASNLRRMEVVNAQGQDIGDISDIVIDLNSGKVHAAVLEFGGFLGIGEKNFAFPIGELKPGKQRNQMVMNIDKQALQSREGFSKNQWPGMDDDYWGRVGGKQAEAAAGAASPGTAQKMNLVRARELLGKQVQDKHGQNVGQVRDVVIGLEEAEVKNIVVAVREGGQASVPGKAIKASGTENRLVLDMSAEQLRAQAQPPQGDRAAGTGGTLNPAERPPAQRPAQPSR
jgi:sporulation protein YlmC with PRC-barrel domain